MPNNKKLLGDIRDDSSSEKLEIAAKAAGVSEEQLVKLVLDSGLHQLTDTQKKLTQETTLESLGQRLWQDALKVPKPDRPRWYKGLTPTQKGSLLAVLRAKGHSSESIIRNFGCSRSAVSKAYNSYAADLGRPLVNIRLEVLAGQLQMMMEKAQDMALKSKDASTYFRVAKDFVGLLQSIGVIDKAAMRIEVDQHVSIGVDERDAQLDKLLDLREKQRIRAEELKKAEFELVQEEDIDPADFGAPPV